MIDPIYFPKYVQHKPKYGPILLMIGPIFSSNTFNTTKHAKYRPILLIIDPISFPKYVQHKSKYGPILLMIDPISFLNYPQHWHNTCQHAKHRYQNAS